MKTLAQYLSETGTKQSELAARVARSRSYISEIVSGTKQPSLALALRIAAATGGQVDIATLVTSSGKAPKHGAVDDCCSGSVS